MLVSWEKQGHATVRCHPLYDEFVATFCPTRADQSRILLANPPRVPLQPRTIPRERTFWALPPRVACSRGCNGFTVTRRTLALPVWATHP
ncbi:MAG: hypothetical protein ACYCW6_03740 [Candidatus Xenobia bacterium]